MSFSNLAVLAVCTSYIALLPINIETQPLLAMLLALGGVRRATWNAVNGLLETRMLGVLLFCIVVYTLVGTLSHGSTAVLDGAKMSLPLLFFLAIYGRPFRPSPYVYYVVLGVHALILALVAAGWGPLIAAFFPRYSYGAGGPTGSGFSFLSPEPGYAAMYLFAVGVAAWRSTEGRQRAIIGACTIGFMLITKSVFAFVLTLLLLLLYTRPKKTLIPLLAVSLSFPFMLNDETVRISAFATTLLRVDASDLVSSLILLEPSGTTRLLKNIPAALYGFTSVIGYGVGSFSDVFSEIASGLDIYESHKIMSDLYYFGGPVSPDSFFVFVLFELGWLSFLYVAAVILCVRRVASDPYVTFVAISAFLLFTLQSQITSPIFLFTIYVLVSPATTAVARRKAHAETEFHHRQLQ